MSQDKIIKCYKASVTHQETLVSDNLPQEKGVQKGQLQFWQHFPVFGHKLTAIWLSYLVKDLQVDGITS